MARRAWRTAAAVLTATTLLAACHSAQRAALAPATVSPTTAFAALPSAPATSPATSPTRQPPRPSVLVTRKLTAIAAQLPDGALSVAAVNLRTGAAYRFGERRGMWAGSVYKLLVLEALLLERQHGDTWFSSYELADITAMIEQSDNKAGYRMFLDAGGSIAIAAAAKRLGLRSIRLGVADPALTTMDARDGITLLRRLVSPGPLSARSQAFVLSLMRNVQADQRWGVGVVADRGTTFANKNGWMDVGDDNGPGEDDGDQWLVNSLGIVRVHGQRVLMAIFTKHNPDCYTGIDLVQKLARVVVQAVAVAAPA
jgi:beta-lactamase class A